jgi:hypothetical protein
VSQQLEVILFAFFFVLASATIPYQLRKTVKKFGPVIAHCLVRPILTVYYRCRVSKQGLRKSV